MIFLSFLSAILAIVNRRKKAAFLAALLSMLIAACLVLANSALHNIGLGAGEHLRIHLIGLDTLRNEAARLLSQSDITKRDSTWFGPIIRADALPEAFRSFKDDVSISRDGQGIVVAYDGLASFRSGYMILPPSSDFIPARSTKIADGIYFIILSDNDGESVGG